MKPYKAIVVDEHMIFADSFCELLKKKVPAFSIVNQCYSLDVAKQKLASEEYDYIFVDVVMPGSNTLGFIEYCRLHYINLIIIAVSSLSEPYQIKELINAGLHAFVSKSADSEEILIAVEKTSAGLKYISNNLASMLATFIYEKEQVSLTKKEREVLRYVAGGLTIAEAAEKMSLSIHTIVGHRRSIMQKLNVRSATEMVKYAFEHKLF